MATIPCVIRWNRVLFSRPVLFSLPLFFFFFFWISSRTVRPMFSLFFNGRALFDRWCIQILCVCLLRRSLILSLRIFLNEHQQYKLSKMSSVLGVSILCVCVFSFALKTFFLCCNWSLFFHLFLFSFSFYFFSTKSHSHTNGNSFFSPQKELCAKRYMQKNGKKGAQSLVLWTNTNYTMFTLFIYLICVHYFYRVFVVVATEPSTTTTTRMNNKDRYKSYCIFFPCVGFL